MKDFLKNNFLILTLYFIVFGTAILFITQYEKIDINLYVNQYVGNKYLNDFFYYITYLGDGRLAGILLLVILTYNVRLGLCSTFSFLTATIVSNTLKYTLFDDVNRPSYIFQWIDKHPINIVEGVDMHIHNSFPSGHATQAFAILLCMAFATGRPALKYLFLLLAILTSFSRVYLSQHWLIDVTAGSLIGTTFSVICYYLFIHRNKFEKLNKSLFDFKT